MRKIILRLFITLISVYILSLIIDTVVIEKSLALLWFALVLFGISLILKPVMMILGFPVSIITFGVFLLVINAWLIMLADWMTPNIQIGGFINALVVAVVVMVSGQFLDEKDKDKLITDESM